MRLGTHCNVRSRQEHMRNFVISYPTEFARLTMLVSNTAKLNTLAYSLGRLFSPYELSVG